MRPALRKRHRHFRCSSSKARDRFPSPRCYILSKTVGDAHARHLLLTASTINAKEAHRIGLIHHVTTSSALPTAIDDLTAQISQLAPQSLTAAKVSLAAINGHATNTDVQNAIQKCYESNDYQKESPPSSKNAALTLTAHEPKSATP